MNFTKGSNTRDLLPPPKMPHEIKEAGFQSREAFCARGCHTSFYLNRCLVCEGPTTAQKQDAEGLPKIAVPQRLAGPSWLRPLLPIQRC